MKSMHSTTINDNVENMAPQVGEYTGTITQKGQVTIPAAVRAYLHLKESDKVSFQIRNGTVVLQKPIQLTLKEVFGAVTPRTRPEDFQAMRDSAIEEHIVENKAREH